MKGKHLITIESARIKYCFEIKRNVTIIQGDSATGKTTLIDLLQDYARDPQNGPVRLQSDVSCVVFSGAEKDWRNYLQFVSGSIIFIDEGYSFIRTKKFADTIRGTDNYYVLITREALTCLPYSIHEIYGIRTTGKYHYPEQIYHEFYPLYQEEQWGAEKFDEPALVINEDSKSGYLFLKACSKNAECISAEGNSNILQLMKKFSFSKKMVIIADGAAFGAFIEKILAFAEFYRDIILFFPESFEWMILKSGIIEISGLNDILDYPEKYVDSIKYFSWEQFFTEFLKQNTAADPIKQYQKNRLSGFYLEGKNKEQILRQYPEEIRRVL